MKTSTKKIATSVAKVPEATLLRQIVKDLHNKSLLDSDIITMWQGRTDIYQAIYNNREALGMFGIPVELAMHGQGTKEYLKIRMPVGDRIRKIKIYPTGMVGLGGLD